MQTEKVKCPVCNSDQIHADKKGFSGKKAVGGVLLTGGIGALAGTLGSNKIVITCLNCGHKFSPGESKKKVERIENADIKIGPIGFIVIAFILAIWYAACN